MSKDLTGQTFGELTVIEQTDNICTARGWLCRCSCGKEVKLSTYVLVSGHTKSCGHLRRQSRSEDLTGRTYLWAVDGFGTGRKLRFPCNVALPMCVWQ